MPLGGLQHYTIEPADLERTREFYCDVLGLANGDRPPLDFPGYWLYCGGVATVHLMGTRKPREGIVVRGTKKKFDDTGRFDHIAFAATDVDGMRQRLRSKNVKFRESIVPRTGDTQFFLYDAGRRRRRTEFPERLMDSSGSSQAPRIQTRSYSGHISGAKRSAFPQFCMTIWAGRRCGRIAGCLAFHLPQGVGTRLFAAND